jgi:polysaccharide deacetylase family protein (PEP-CTERM system associated)
VEQGIERVLELLARHEAQGTFFTLGVVAERTPHVVRRIAEAGHEVASHGWSHRRVNQLSPDQFRDEVARARDVLQQLTGKPVLGYRAPNFSIISGCEWAFEILGEEGYRYDSSVFPARRRGSSFAGTVQTIGDGSLIEVPMSAAQLGPVHLPACGGAWFRLFPYTLTRAALRQAARRGVPGVFYIHPWELDWEQPRVTVNLPTAIRHYGGMQRVPARIERMLHEFRFTSVAAWLDRSWTPVAA